MALEDIARLGLVLDTTRFQGAEAVRTLEDIRAKAGPAASSVGVLERAFETAKRGALALLAVFGGFRLQQFARETINLASRYETLGIVLERVGASAGYSAGFLQNLQFQLQKTGISMVASRQTIISFIQSQLDLADATKLARAAQDAAVTANLNSSQTLLRIIRGIQSGETEILRTIGLNVSWEKSYQKLAAQMGRGVDTLTQQEKATARVNAVMEAAKPIAGAYEAAMNTAGKQVQSMRRYIDDLQVKLGELALPVYTKMVFTFADIVKLAANNIGAFITIIGALTARALVPMVSRGLRAANEAFTTLNQHLSLGPKQALSYARGIEVVAHRELAAAKAAQALAAAEVQGAIAFEAKTGTALATALAMDNLGRANTQVALATRAATAATAQATLAQRALTLSARVTATAMATLRGAMAFFGGPIGVAIVAIGAAIAYMASQTDKAADYAKEHADALEKEADYLAALNVQIERRNELEGKDQKAAKGSRLREEQELLDELQRERDKAVTGFYAVSPREREFDKRIRDLNLRVHEGKLTLNQFSGALVNLAQSFPEEKFTDHIADIIIYNRTVQAQTTVVTDMKAAALETAKGLQTLGTEAEVTAGKFDLLGMASRDTKKEIENSVDLLTALQRGGTQEYERVKRGQDVLARAQAIWQEYAETQQRAGEKAEEFGMRVEEAANAGNVAAQRAIEISGKQLALGLALARTLAEEEERRKRAKEAVTAQVRATADLKEKLTEELDETRRVTDAMLGGTETLERYNRQKQFEALRREINTKALEKERAALLKLVDAMEAEQEAQDDARRIIASRERFESLEQERSATERLLFATRLGKRAVEEVTIALAVERAVREAKGVIQDKDLKRLEQEVRRLLELRAALDRATEGIRRQEEARKRAQERRREEIERELAPYRAAIENLNQTLAQGFESVFKNGIRGWKEFANAVKDIILRMVAQIAAALTIKALGLDKLLEQITKAGQTPAELPTLIPGPDGEWLPADRSRPVQSRAAPGAEGPVLPVSTSGRILGYASVGVSSYAIGSTVGGMTTNRPLGVLGGVASGAATGAAIGSVVPGVGTLAGGIVGGVIGGIGGFFGSSKAEEEEKKRREALQDALDDFVESIDPDRSPLTAALERLEDQFRELAEAADELDMGDKVKPALTAMREAQEFLQEEFLKDFEAQIRELRDEGFINEFLDIQEAYEQNMRDLAAAGGDLTRAQELRTLQEERLFKSLSAIEAERLAEEFPAYAEAIRKAQQELEDERTAAARDVFQITRTVTEVTAQRQVALQATANVWLEQIAKATGTLATLASGGTFTSSAPAPAPAATATETATADLAQHTVLLSQIESHTRGLLELGQATPPPPDLLTVAPTQPAKVVVPRPDESTAISRSIDELLASLDRTPRLDRERMTTGVLDRTTFGRLESLIPSPRELLELWKAEAYAKPTGISSSKDAGSPTSAIDPYAVGTLPDSDVTIQVVVESVQLVVQGDTEQTPSKLAELAGVAADAFSEKVSEGLARDTRIKALAAGRTP